MSLSLLFAVLDGVAAVGLALSSRRQERNREAVLIAALVLLVIAVVLAVVSRHHRGGGLSGVGVASFAAAGDPIGEDALWCER